MNTQFFSLLGLNVDDETAAVIRRLAFEEEEDADSVTTSAGVPPSVFDEDYALQLQAEDLQDWDLVSEDASYAWSLYSDSTDGFYRQAVMDVEATIAEDRAIAEMLSRHEASAAQTTSQISVERLNSIMRQSRVDSQSRGNRTAVVAVGPQDDSHNERVITPYKWRAWQRHLEQAGIFREHKGIVEGIRCGFKIGFPVIKKSQLPTNYRSTTDYPEHFNGEIAKELLKGRYTGPYSKAELEFKLGPCQSSPITIIPKPARPGKFRTIQNFSFPREPNAKHPNESINSFCSAEEWPCTFGTFHVTCLLIRDLPAGSQAAVRDVSEAYRTVPLHPSQWSAAVVRAPGDDSFYIDSCAAFGARSAGGVFGKLADCEGDIFRANGMGPTVKWVDDNLFLRIPRTEIRAYNIKREEWRRRIEVEGRHKQGGRTWFGNGIARDGSGFEAVEDFRFPIRDLSGASPRSSEDAKYSYCFQDLDDLSEELGIPWEKSKDQPFASTATYIGLIWNLENKTVSLPAEKRDKYVENIDEWSNNLTHTLEETQQIYGRLMHAALVIPSGRARLLQFEDMMSFFDGETNQRARATEGVPGDLAWWREKLQCPTLVRSIPGLVEPIDIHAFCDASTEVGIGITINGWWRAWRLLPGWDTRGGIRDISWGEAIGFELLVDAVLRLVPRGQHTIIHCDNQGVVCGWWNGRSRNIEVNEIFKCIHDKLEAAGVWGTMHTVYVKSADNPADDLSRGRLPSDSKLLPQIPLPKRAKGLIIDALEPRTPEEINSPLKSHMYARKVKPSVTVQPASTPARRVKRNFFNTATAYNNGWAARPQWPYEGTVEDLF